MSLSLCLKCNNYGTAADSVASVMFNVEYIDCGTYTCSNANAGLHDVNMSPMLSGTASTNTLIWNIPAGQTQPSMKVYAVSDTRNYCCETIDYTYVDQGSETATSGNLDTPVYSSSNPSYLTFNVATAKYGALAKYTFKLEAQNQAVGVATSSTNS